MAAIPKRLKEIEDRNAIAGDSTRLYSVIKGLADDYDVVVRRLVGRAQSPSAGSTIMVNRIDLMVEGEYERVARFVAAVEGIDGFMRTASLKISPMQHDGQSLVTAQFTCEARQFPVDAVTALMEGSNAQP